MARQVDAIVDEVLSLSEQDRAEIAHRVIRSLDGPEPSAAEQAEIDAAWGEEIRRRIRDVEEGRVQLIDGDEVLRKLRTRRPS